MSAANWQDSDAFRAARSLCEDGGPGEYVRACAEMVCDLSGTSVDDKEAVIAALIAPRGSVSPP